MKRLVILPVVIPLALFFLTHRETLAPTAFGREWAVASSHQLATWAGQETLRQGGSAADSAVAVAFMLAVVYPEAGNLGGGFLAVGYEAADTKLWMLDARETAPRAITRETFVALGEGSSLRGPYASGIPGTPAGLKALHEKYGRLAWRDLVLPAAAVAERGFALSPRAVANLNRSQKLLKQDENARRQFWATRPVTGAILRQPELAATLRRLAADPNDFYGGATARLIVADALKYGSPITTGDLSAYEAKWREPVKCPYRSFDIVSSAPPSSGGAIVCETAQILAPFLLSALPVTGARTMHLTAEAWRQAFIDRNLLGDSDFVTAPIKAITSAGYGAKIAALIRLDKTGLAGPAPSPEKMETTHFSIVDAQGNAIAFTTTLNGAFGNGHVVTGGGFLMNNEMDDFNTRPGHPNLYGLMQGEANAPAPGKRMLSSMSPTLVFHRGKLVLVTGTPGGSTIPTTVWQILSKLIDAGWTLDRAVAWPRYHFQGSPDKLFYESGALTAQVVEQLGALGYQMEKRTRATGDVEAIAWNTGRKQWMAVSDPRGEGLPLAR